MLPLNIKFTKVTRFYGTLCTPANVPSVLLLTVTNCHRQRTKRERKAMFFSRSSFKLNSKRIYIVPNMVFGDLKVKDSNWTLK